MLQKFRNKLFAGVLSLAVFSSCEKIKNFGDINVNPNGSTNPNTAFLLTNVLAGQSGLDFNAGYYVQYFTDPIYPNNALYSFTQAGLGDYSGSLMDLQNIINYNINPATKDQPYVGGNGANQNQIAICRIVKALVYWRNSDVLGDIPYFEALKGEEGLFSPAYDRQEEIYKDIIRELSEAVDQFDNNTQIPAMKGDIIYSGDREKWKKIANSLRLLMAVRLSKKFPDLGQYAAQQVLLATEHPAGIIETNADNFTINYPGGVYSNPLATETQSGLSKTFTDILNGMNDQRLSVFGARAFTGANSNSPSNIGIPYGINAGDGADFTSANPNWARILVSSRRQGNSPYVVVGAASVLLARAEAIERGWIIGDAEDDYVAGVQASFDQWGLSYVAPTAFTWGTGAGVAEIGVNQYNSIPATSNATTTTNLQRIHLQQYIAWFPNARQAWADWRRTGVPALQATNFDLNSGAGIPRRYAYSTAQYSTNGPNVEEAVSRLTGGDTQEARVWWDE